MTLNIIPIRIQACLEIISSPGLDALNAALNPYPEFMEPNEPMLFFVLMDPETGLHAFNSTL